MRTRLPIIVAASLRRGGFTMIEIAIALGVIGFALVAIMGILPLGLNVQRDNRFETIINQDATYWLEAIRNGAQHASAYDDNDLTNYVYRIVVKPTNGSPVTYGDTGDMLGVAPLLTTSNIISLLTRPYGGVEVSAYVRAISGSAGEKRSDVAFGYRMDVFLTQPDATNMPTLWDLRLQMKWPVVQGKDPAGARKPLVYRTMISRNVATTPWGSDNGYLFTP